MRLPCLITLNLIDQLRDIDLHHWTPARGWNMGCHQYTTASKSTTLESNKSVAQHFFSPLCPWSRRTASVLPLSSGIPPSAPRTGQVAFTTSGGPIPAASAFSHILHAVGYESLVLSLWFFLCPECLDPFPLCPAFPDSLDGRDSVEYYGSAAPASALVTYPPIHEGSSCRFRRCSRSNFSVSRRYPSVILMTCEQAREACSH